MLMDSVVGYCNYEYEKHFEGGCCTMCSHPILCKNNGDCKECLDEVHWLKENGRIDYECINLINYYTCRYSYKYCSEIMYALEKIHIRKYPKFTILSLGCGAAPDLMAFEQITRGHTDILYKGIDKNILWKNIHTQIEEYCTWMPSIKPKFFQEDVIDLFSRNVIFRDYNVLTMQYFISHLYNTNQTDKIDMLFDSIISKMLPHKRTDSPFLIIINDVDSIHKGRSYFTLLEEKIKSAGYSITADRMRFKPENYLAYSEQYITNKNKFSIPEDIKSRYKCAITCESAQIIIEVN